MQILTKKKTFRDETTNESVFFEKKIYSYTNSNYHNKFNGTL